MKVQSKYSVPLRCCCRRQIITLQLVVLEGDHKDKQIIPKIASFSVYIWLSSLSTGTKVTTVFIFFLFILNCESSTSSAIVFVSFYSGFIWFLMSKPCLLLGE